MTLKLQLVKGSRILCEVPLSVGEWTRHSLELEIHEMQRELENFAKVMGVLGNANRVRMVARLMEDGDFTLGFKDFIEELGLNPKLVREHAKRLSEAGFLESPQRGKYSLSPLGRIRFLAVGPGMRRILQEISDQLETIEELGPRRK